MGCGACSYVCPEKKIRLIDFKEDGIRPVITSNNCSDCDVCIKVCPGYETIHKSFSNTSEMIPQLKEGWGPILEVWEGYAADPGLRYNGSSGGLASAIALYCLEKGGAHGVLHTAASHYEPWKNKTVLSQNRQDILSRTGSRYLPASPCDGLSQIESAPETCVFIGKPCDVAGLRKAQALKKELDEKVEVAIGIFCAGTPATQGTLELFKNLDINLNEIEDIRYRGKGWPGMFTVTLKGKDSLTRSLSYKESWSFLQKYRPYRCYLCPDGTSEFADISCGDPWYRQIKEDDSGYSLVLVRTEKGRKILQGAIDTGYVILEKVNPKILVDSQINLLSKRSTIWGRLFAMKSFGIPTPQLRGFSLFKNWWSLPVYEKIRSLFGTTRRIIQRKYYKQRGFTSHQ